MSQDFSIKKGKTTGTNGGFNNNFLLDNEVTNNSKLSSNDQLKSLDSYQYTGRVDDIDVRDRDDPLAVAEYAQDMYSHFRSQEVVTSVRPHFLNLQPQISESMRSILIDWLISVQVQFKLTPDTLYLTVNIIDRYLEKAQVPRSKLQLVGVTSLFIASKYEETYMRTPHVRDMVALCDNLYTRQEIVQMETSILNALQYKISVPTAHTFLVRYLKAGHADKTIAQVANYVLEGTLQSYPLLKYLPSQLAAASVFIARSSTGRNPWSPTLLKYGEYCEEEIVPVARAILDTKSRKSSELTAVNKKYGARRYGRVANALLSCD